MVNRKKLLVLGSALVIAIAAGIGGLLAFREPVVEVRMAVPERMRSAAIYVALDKGYFADQRLRVTIAPIPTGKEALARTLTGEFDFAAVAGLPVVSALADGGNVAILAAIAQAERHVAILTTKAVGAQMADLRGKRVGILRGTTSELFLNTMLDATGIEPGAVTAVPLTVEEFVDAIPSGRVDAVSAWDPVLSQVRSRLGANLAEIHNNGAFVDYWLLTASDPWLSGHEKVAIRVLRALSTANAMINSQPEEARAIAARWTSKDAEPWDPGIYVLRLDSAMPKVLQTTVRVGLRKGDLPSLDGAIRPELLRAVAPTAVTIER